MRSRTLPLASLAAILVLPLFAGCTTAAKDQAMGNLQAGVDAGRSAQVATTQAAQTIRTIAVADPVQAAQLDALSSKVDGLASTLGKSLDLAQQNLNVVKSAKNFDLNDPAVKSAITSIATGIAAAVPGGQPFAPLVAVAVPSILAIGALFSHGQSAMKLANNAMNGPPQPDPIDPPPAPAATPKAA